MEWQQMQCRKKDGREHVVLCAVQLQSRKAWHAMDKLGVMKVRHSTAAVAECPWFQEFARART